MYLILNNYNRGLLDKLMGGKQMICPITVEEKGNASWVDDATRGTSHTKRAFLPWKIIIIMGRGFI